MDKAQLRLAMQDLRMRLKTEAARKLSERIALRLLKRREIAAASAIGLYSAVRGEVSTEACFHHLRRNAALYFPRVAKTKTKRLDFVRIDDWKQLKRGYSGILEPPDGLPATPLQEIGVLVIPGLAFDLECNRIGWGQGFYDRVLKKYSGLRVALAYDFQVLEKVPSTSKDIPMNVVITESREIQIKASPRAKLVRSSKKLKN